MPRYFRADSGANPNDLALLPAGLRDHGDLVNLAARAEDAVLAAFTRDTPHPDATVLDQGTAAERSVWLRCYAEDPAQAAPAFADALRRAVARQLRWLAAQDDKKVLVANEAAAGDAGSSKTYRDDAEGALAPDALVPLQPFAIRVAPALGWAI